MQHTAGRLPRRARHFVVIPTNARNERTPPMNDRLARASERHDAGTDEHERMRVRREHANRARLPIAEHLKRVGVFLHGRHRGGDAGELDTDFAGALRHWVILLVPAAGGNSPPRSPSFDAPDDGVTAALRATRATWEVRIRVAPRTRRSDASANTRTG